MANDQELVIKITGQTKDAVNDIKQVDDQIKKLSKTSKSLSGDATGIDGLSRSFKSLGGTIKGLVAGFVGLQTVTTAIEWTKMAADAEQSADTFDRIFQDIGKNAEEEFAKIKEASQDLIPDSAIKQSVATANQLGVPLEKMAELMEVARVQARIMGTDVESAFNDLAVGIGRGSPMILDNLGLVIKVEEANKKWAASNNKTVESMTKQEKQLALTNAVLKAASDSVKKYGNVQLTSKQQMQQFNSEMQNFKETVGAALLPAMAALAESTTEFLKSMDDEDIKRFSQSIESTVETMNQLAETIRTLNDYGMPDWLTGEKDAGLADTVLKGWGLLLDYINDVVYSFTKLGDATDEQSAKFDKLIDASRNLDGTDKSFDDLTASIQKTIAENDKLIDRFDRIGSMDAIDAIEELTKQNKALNEVLDDISKQKAFEHLDDGIKKAMKDSQKLTDLTKKYNAAKLKEIAKSNEKEIKLSEKKVAKLTKDEEKLVADILQLHQQLEEKLKQIDQERFQSNLDIEQKIRDIGYNQLNDLETYNQKQIDAQKALSQAKEALLNGDLEKYRAYMDEYVSLATAGAGQAIEIEGVVLKTKQETAAKAIDALNEEKRLDAEYYKQKETLAKQANDAAAAQKQAELDAIQAQLEGQKALLEAQKKLTEAMTGQKIPLDLSAIDASIIKIQELKQKLTEINATPSKVNMDDTAVDITRQKVEELRALTLNGVTLPVDADTTPADFGIKKMITEVEGDEIKIGVNPEYKEAEKKIEDFRKGEEKDPAEIPVDANTKPYEDKTNDVKKKTEEIKPVVNVDADTSEAKAKISEIKQPTQSTHTVIPDTTAAQAAIDRLKVTTHSLHIVDVVYNYSGGGPAGAPVASGGTAASMGAMRSVSPSMQGSAPSSSSPSAVINISLGSSNYKLFAEKSVGERLAKEIERFGGWG